MAGREVKIVVAGYGGVGKSAMTIMLTKNHFVDEYDPTIEDSYRMQVNLDGQTVLLDILDTAGMEEYSAMQMQWYRYAEALMYIYSITSRPSLEEVDVLHKRVLQAREDSGGHSFPMILCGNKVDLESERKVTKEEGQQVAERIGAEFFETSAKEKINIEEAFFAAARSVIKANPNPKNNKSGKRKKENCLMM